jgi:hypothetical protein
MDVAVDELHRTVKLEMDEGRAASPEEALHLAETYVLQLHVGGTAQLSRARQAALLTIINCGRRAFLGGVRVCAEDNPPLNVRWAEGMRLHEAVAHYGGTMVGQTSADYPTLVLGDPTRQPGGTLRLHPTWDGWRAGVVEDCAERLPERQDFALSGVLAGALGVSEAFQHVRGDLVAGRRSFGVSLWRPDLDWRDENSLGPECRYLPSRIWILGLGHLGQAYCWSLGFLPYPDPSEVLLLLQDFDVVVEANDSTGLLIDRTLVGRTKARAVAHRLERIDFRTRISERAFDSHTKRTADEPSLALAGFDDPAPRRLLEQANFESIVDAGLGGGPEQYGEILVHAFPSGIDAASAFGAAPARSRRPYQAAYLEMIERRVDAGASRGQAECGVLEIAGRTVGAAFVGATAGTLVVAEVLRMLNGGPGYQVVDFSLRSPQHRVAVINERPRASTNPGFVRAALN